MLKQSNDSPSRLRVILLCCMGLLVGVTIPLAAGWRRPSSRVEPVAAPTVESRPLPALPRSVVLGPVTAQLGEDDKESLRRLMRDEIKSGQAVAPAREEQPRDPDTVIKSLPPEQLTSYRRAQQLVDEAASTKLWREDDRRQLRSTLAGLPQPLHEQVVLALINAVNEGQIHFEGTGPLF
jgi:hypothetical protein